MISFHSSKRRRSLLRWGMKTKAIAMGDVLGEGEAFRLILYRFYAPNFLPECYCPYNLLLSKGECVRKIEESQLELDKVQAAEK